MSIRDLVEEDLPWMAQVEKDIFTNAAWSEALIREDWRYGTCRYRTVEVDGAPAGYAVYGYDGDAFHLMNLAIVSGFRGRGLAKALVGEFLDEAERHKAPDAWLEVAVNNEEALGLYRALGFEVVRTRRKYYQPGGIDALVMRKELRPYIPGGHDAANP
ncbi:MAG: ribosomal protein S18-alanine N-acetyltransferase [Demequinaceae bacterium]|nr:ribosomal protein S18-alanine N-acetyltransferase [Demequinaceae bacterium]